MSDNAELERRIEALESRLAFVDDAQNTLSDTVVQISREVETLRQALERVVERLGELASAAEGEASGGQERPPHY